MVPLWQQPTGVARTRHASQIAIYHYWWLCRATAKHPSIPNNHLIATVASVPACYHRCVCVFLLLSIASVWPKTTLVYMHVGMVWLRCGCCKFVNNILVHSQYHMIHMQSSSHSIYILYIFSAVHIVTSTVDTAECALISHRHAVASTESLALHCAVAVHSCDDCIPSQCIPMQCMTAWMALHEHRVVVDEWLSNILPNFLVHARHPHTHTHTFSPHPPGKPCNKYIGIALH